LKYGRSNGIPSDLDVEIWNHEIRAIWGSLLEYIRNLKYGR
jgi:hypothetical protein